MKASVVVPTYNGRRFVGETIASVCAQTMADWELVVVDDGSTDATPALLAEAAAADRRVRVLRQANGGIAAARTAGLAATCPESEYVLFLDHDDVLRPDALDTLIGALEAEPSAVAAQGIASYIDGEGRLSRAGECEQECRSRGQLVGGRVRPLAPGQPAGFATIALWGCIMTMGLVVMRARTVRQVGSFDSAMVPSDDWDMYLRIARSGDILFVDRVTLHYRRHESNVSRNMHRVRAAQRRVMRKALASPENSAEQARTLRQAFRASQRYFLADKAGLAVGCLRRGDLAGAARQTIYSVRHAARYLRGRP